MWIEGFSFYDFNGAEEYIIRVSSGSLGITDCTFYNNGAGGSDVYYNTGSSGSVSSSGFYGSSWKLNNVACSGCSSLSLNAPIFDNSYADAIVIQNRWKSKITYARFLWCWWDRYFNRNK